MTHPQQQPPPPNQAGQEGAVSLHVFTHGVDCVIAASPEDAAKVYCEFTGETEYDESYEPFKQVADDKSMTITCEDEDTITTMTAAQWIKKEGRSFLCSTEN